MHHSLSSSSIGGSMPVWQGPRRSSVGAIANNAKFGMFQDTTISGATRKQQLIIQRERAERARITEAQERLKHEVEQEEKKLEIALKKRKRKEERQRKRQMQVLYNQAANTIQFHWFAFLDRRDYEAECALSYASVVVQKYWRRYRGYQVVKRLRHEKCVFAASRIVRWAKYILRCRLLKSVRKSIACSKIQTLFRKYRKVQHGKRRVIEKSAVTIQKHVRVLSARKRALRRIRARKKKQNRLEMSQEDKLHQNRTKTEPPANKSSQGFFLTATHDLIHEPSIISTAKITTQPKKGKQTKPEVVEDSLQLVEEQALEEKSNLSSRSGTPRQEYKLKKLVSDQIRKHRKAKRRQLELEQLQLEEAKKKRELARQKEHERVLRIREATRLRIAQQQKVIEEKVEEEKAKQEEDKIEKIKQDSIRKQKAEEVKRKIKKALAFNKRKQEEKKKQKLKQENDERLRLELAKKEFAARDKARLEKIRVDAKLREKHLEEVQKRKEIAEQKAKEEAQMIKDAQNALRVQKEFQQQQRQKIREAKKKAKLRKQAQLEQEQLEKHKAEMEAKAQKLLQDTRERLKVKTKQMSKPVSFRSRDGRINYMASVPPTVKRPSRDLRKKPRSRQTHHLLPINNEDNGFIPSISLMESTNQDDDSRDGNGSHSLDTSSAVLLPRLKGDSTHHPIVSNSKHDEWQLLDRVSGEVSSTCIDQHPVLRSFTPSHPLNFLADHHRKLQQESKSRARTQKRNEEHKRSKAISKSRRRRRRRINNRIATPVLGSLRDNSHKGNDSSLLERALAWKKSQDISNGLVDDRVYSSSDDESQVSKPEADDSNYDTDEFEAENDEKKNAVEDSSENDPSLMALEQDCAARTIQLAFLEKQHLRKQRSAQ